jgi:hypothetical protein
MPAPELRCRLATVAVIANCYAKALELALMENFVSMSLLMLCLMMHWHHPRLGCKMESPLLT